MKEAGILPHHIEGHRGGTWILQDYGDVVVHLFDTEARAFYDLDRLRAGRCGGGSGCHSPAGRLNWEASGLPHPFCNPLISRNRKCDQIEIRV